MNIIINENDIVNNALKYNIIHKKPTITIKALIKYYYSLGYNKKNIKIEIESFMSKNYISFNNITWDNIINKLINKYANDSYKLLVINNIKITQIELVTISNLNNLKQEKILFVLLVYAKIFNQINNENNNWTNSKDKDIFSDAKLTLKIVDQRLALHKLFQTNLISPAKKVDNTNICVNFINENSKNVIILSDFRNFVYEYLKWKGEKIGYCIKCGNRFKITSNRKQYCNSCWKEREKELWRNSKKRNRNK
ncbi:hypothetical protein [Anaerovorax odorimutans]|uniref:hypothetical protein n=1 Tax=Anaerovorax odorimutans TaxID=109327 RepID=UPI000420DDFE|nr:hypothetical protein [Anaerovorax odorimutans]